MQTIPQLSPPSLVLNTYIGQEETSIGSSPTHPLFSSSPPFDVSKMMNGRSCRYPFTASQWQELEHQALIFKYMAAGIPIPSDLILPLRRSFLLDSTTSTTPSLAFAPQPSLGWGCYQLGYGSRGKAEDPEPGRCRRTDGKKWRCSKEAYPDSKYCERHMHRGKNRSRKPVELSLSPTTPTTNPSSISNSHYYPLLPLSISNTNETPHHHLFYPYSCCSRPLGIALQPQNNTTHFHLDSHSYHPLDKDYRCCHGVRDVDEYSFSEASSGTERESCLQFRPLGMSPMDEPKQSSFEVDLDKEEEKQQQRQHCLVLGADFKLEKPVKLERDEAQRPLRHFFDEWPQKSKGSWMDLEEEHSTSKTQLSISIPMPHHGYRNGD